MQTHLKPYAYLIHIAPKDAREQHVPACEALLATSTRSRLAKHARRLIRWAKASK